MSDKSTILLIELVTPTPSKIDALGDKSWILRACASFPDRSVLAFGVPGSRKDQSLGRLFSGLKSLDGDVYEIELAAVLTERLPSPENQSEYCLMIAGTHTVGQTLCLSNAMHMIRYRKGDVDRHAICPAAATAKFVDEHKEEFVSHPHVELLPSVVTARYETKGIDAEDALSSHLETAIDDFIAAINRLVAAYLVTTDHRKIGILTPAYDRGSFPWLYLIIRGADNQFAAQRIATHLLRTALVHPSYDKGSWEKFSKHASGDLTVDIALKALRTAESHIQTGVYEFALLLLAIAVEVATSRFVYSRLQEEGVSRAKLQDIEADLTFSVMLNTQVAALAPRDRKPDPLLIGEVNRIRKLRNDLMHEGKFEVSRAELGRLINSAQQYLAYLDSLEEIRIKS